MIFTFKGLKTEGFICLKKIFCPDGREAWFKTWNIDIFNNTSTVQFNVMYKQMHSVW